MNNDDLRTLAYCAMVELGAQCGPLTPDSTRDLFIQARQLGLCDHQNQPDGSIKVVPIPSRPPTQVAGVQGIASHRGMGDKP